MLTAVDNELMTRVGPGTPGGDLLRRYWHPIAAAQQLDKNPVRKVKILGEELALYRDRSGALGLLGLRCPHRLMSLEYGIPEEEGLRCGYHGWMFNEEGRCIETPLEPPDSTFKEKVEALHYPVQEMGGLVWAYLGPEPAPLLPRWDLFVRPGGFRQIVAHHLPCNWLQVMENRGDLGHATYLHGRLAQYALERQGRLTDDSRARYNVTMRQQRDRLDRGVFTKYQPVWNQFGFTKGNLESDKSEDSLSWTIGANSFLFPYILTFAPYAPGTIRKSYQIGVPLDDTSTWHFQYFYYDFPPGVERAGAGRRALRGGAAGLRERRADPGQRALPGHDRVVVAGGDCGQDAGAPRRLGRVRHRVPEPAEGADQGGAGRRRADERLPRPVRDRTSGAGTGAGQRDSDPGAHEPGDEGYRLLPCQLPQGLQGRLALHRRRRGQVLP